MMPQNPRYQTAMNQRTHIPQHIEAAMNQHLQQAMPAHLKKYMGGQGGYVPQHAQKQIDQFMQKSMPTHLKQYAGAYMEQRVVQPNLNHPRVGGNNTVMPQGPRPGFQPPVPDHLRRGHSMPGNEQHTVELNTLPNATPLFQAESPPPAAQPAPPPGPNYEFIMSPEQQPKQRRLPDGNSTLSRSLYVGAGLLLLLVAFSVLKGILSGTPNTQAFIPVIQDQQELIHLVTNASQQPNLNTTNLNFAATASLTLDSSRAALETYLATNHAKLNPKTLNLKISTATDQRLTDAAAATTYNETFQEIMKSQLATYSRDLSQAYNKASGKKGRALLSDEYRQTQLLIEQLNSPAS